MQSKLSANLLLFFPLIYIRPALRKKMVNTTELEIRNHYPVLGGITLSVLLYSKLLLKSNSFYFNFILFIKRQFTIFAAWCVL